MTPEASDAGVAMSNRLPILQNAANVAHRECLLHAKWSASHALKAGEALTEGGITPRRQNRRNRQNYSRLCDFDGNNLWWGFVGFVGFVGRGGIWISAWHPRRVVLPAEAKRARDFAP